LSDPGVDFWRQPAESERRDGIPYFSDRADSRGRSGIIPAPPGGEEPTVRPDGVGLTGLGPRVVERHGDDENDQHKLQADALQGWVDTQPRDRWNRKWIRGEPAGCLECGDAPAGEHNGEDSEEQRTQAEHCPQGELRGRPDNDERQGEKNGAARPEARQHGARASLSQERLVEQSRLEHLPVDREEGNRGETPECFPAQCARDLGADER